MTLILIFNLVAVIGLLLLLAATMRLPYRLPVEPGMSARRANRAAKPSSQPAPPASKPLRRAEPGLELS